MKQLSIIKDFVANLKNKYKYGLTEQDCINCIEDVCAFFSIPAPILIQNVTAHPSLSTCVMNRDQNTLVDDILCYDLQELRAMGVSDKMGFTAVMTHECAHRVFQNYSFPGPNNGEWESEMIADYFMGVKIGLEGWNVTPLINALESVRGSGTHPVGKIRGEYVRLGIFEARRHMIQRRTGTLQEYIQLFLEYRERHIKELRESELKIY